jgi:hypothetical protein
MHDPMTPRVRRLHDAAIAGALCAVLVAGVVTLITTAGLLTGLFLLSAGAAGGWVAALLTRARP